MSRHTGLAAALVLLCTAPLDARTWRSPISPPAVSGWQRLVLSAGAQRVSDTLWLSDAEGTALPFLRGATLDRASFEVELADVVEGLDEAGRPVIELSPRRRADAAPGSSTPDLRVAFAIAAETPWIARLEVERQRAEGPWIARDDGPIWLDDLGAGRRRTEATIPWDGDRFRLRLVPLEERALRVDSFTVTATTRIDREESDERIDLAVDGPRPDRDGEAWRLALPERDRLVALELSVAPPLAPVEVVARAPAPDRSTPGRILARGAIWELPALDSRRTEVALRLPAVVEELDLQAPAGTRLQGARGVIRREILLFPAAAGQALYLHGGGVPARFAGDLGALAVDAAVHARPPLTLGPAEPDPHARTRSPTLADSLRRILVPLVVLAAALLAWTAWRLFHERPAPEADET